MTEAIRLSCRCGSTFSMECNSYAAGGRRDDKGRMYIAEVRADAWMAAHADCLRVLEWTPAGPRVKAAEEVAPASAASPVA